LILERLMLLVPLLLSLTVHEWAHAYSAFRLGDDTAERQGRLTLDPMAHIDFWGTLVLPLAGIPFGWAKPVPVNPARFKRSVSMRTGMLLTAFAGPLSNAVIALVCAVSYGLMFRLAPAFLMEHPALGALLWSAITINVALALFNMLPIPPLDGSRVVDGLVPPRFERHWEQYCRYAPFLLLFVVAAPSVLHLSVLNWPFTQVYKIVSKLISLLAGSAEGEPEDALHTLDAARVLAAVSIVGVRDSLGLRRREPRGLSARRGR
jgi:Zn-dependent protease